MKQEELTRPIASIDVETTSADPATARIIQLGLFKIYPGWEKLTFRECTLFDPRIPIPPQSTEVHHITDEMVKGKPTFKDLAHIIVQFLTDCDLVGYNLTRFDVPVLWEEFYRCGIVWNLDGARIIDAHAIFVKMEPRTLDAAVRKYCGRPHEGAHNALNDALATWDVFQAQVATHADLAGMTLDRLHELSKFENRIDLAGKLVRNAKGEAIFNFGKNKGKRVADDLGYAHWMLEKDFSTNTKIHLAEEMDKINAAQPNRFEPF